MKMMSVGLDNLVMPSEEAIEITRNNASAQDCNMGNTKKWAAGEMEFEAEMRKLDNAVSQTVPWFFLIHCCNSML